MLRAEGGACCAQTGDIGLCFFRGGVSLALPAPGVCAALARPGLCRHRRRTAAYAARLAAALHAAASGPLARLRLLLCSRAADAAPGACARRGDEGNLRRRDRLSRVPGRQSAPTAAPRGGRTSAAQRPRVRRDAESLQRAAGRSRALRGAALLRRDASRSAQRSV